MEVDQTCNEQNHHNSDNVKSPLISIEKKEENTFHMENKECQDEISSQIELDLYDPGNWKNINSNMRYLIIERGPIGDVTSNLDFSRDENSRYFSIIHC